MNQRVEANSPEAHRQHLGRRLLRERKEDDVTEVGSCVVRSVNGKEVITGRHERRSVAILQAHG